MRAVMAAYETLRSKNPSAWPELRLTKARANDPETLDYDTAGQRLTTVNHGWARHRSGIRRLSEAAGADFGPPLFAEWVEAGGATSFRLAPHPNAPGLLALWRYAEEDGDAAIEVAAQDVAVLDVAFDPSVKDDAAPILVYRVYWGAPDGTSAVRRLFARFLGFREQPEFRGRPLIIRRSRS